MKKDIGYDLRIADVDFLTSHYGQAIAWRSLIAVGMLHLQIVASFIFSGILWCQLPMVANLALPIFALVAGRSLRGLENMVHEASHGNLANRGHWLNQAIGEVICSSATLHRLQNYRADHRRHHLFFGTTQDPDWTTFAMLGVDQLPKFVSQKKWIQVACVAAAYIRHHYARLASPQCAVRFGLWQAVLFVPVWLVFDATGLSPWGYTFGLWATTCVVWPLVRLCAEAAEHDYAPPVDLFHSTYTTLGWRTFFFPLGDGFHLLHHLVPTVPFFRLGEAHKRLCQRDAHRFGAHHRRRGAKISEAKMSAAHSC